MNTPTPAQVLSYEFNVMIQAPRARVWTALTEEINCWWLAGFHMVAEDSVVSLDTHAGGQLLESHDDAGSLLWYTVSMCVPESSLHMIGHIAPAFGGPTTSLLELGLSEEKGETILLVREGLLGKVSAKSASRTESGWQQLFGEGLRVYVEGA
jgi:uncharacterized protein YndB with AHSA1/START domain